VLFQLCLTLTRTQNDVPTALWRQVADSVKYGAERIAEGTRSAMEKVGLGKLGKRASGKAELVKSSRCRCGPVR